MNNLRKIILMSLIPVLLTIFFIVQFTVPSVKEYFNLKKEIKSEKTEIKDIKSNLERLNANKKLVSKLNGLNIELADFDTEFPSTFKDAILLIDLEMFADKTINHIVRVISKPEKTIDIIDPSSPKKKNRRRRRRNNNKEKAVPPVTVIEKPFELSTVAYYNQIIDFVTFLEDYQRKIDIQSIYTQVFSEDKDNPNPKVELKIKGNIYKSIINNKISEKQDILNAK